MKYISAAYLGFALSFFGNIHFDNWRFYVITISYFLLTEIINHLDNSNTKN